MPAGRCDECGTEEYMPFVCKFCKGRYCAAHRLPENHGCQGLDAHRERLRAEGRIMRPEPDLVKPRVSHSARAGMSMDAFWSRVDGKVTWVILGVTLAVFALQYVVLMSAGAATHNAIFAIGPTFYLQPWTILTSIFSHSGPSHLFFNMLFLFFFGTSVERLLGSRRFTYLYLGAGIVAGLAQVVISNYIMGSPRPSLGASGALQGLVGLLVLLAPRATVYVMGIIPAPMWAFGAFFVVMDVVGAFNPGSNTGHFAHLAGFAAGAYYAYSLKQQGMRVQSQPRQEQPPWR